tara:strand:+ start:87 stop:350 length:264 start_codon:yes stop_codon:yes gene_type:complete
MHLFTSKENKKHIKNNIGDHNSFFAIRREEKRRERRLVGDGRYKAFTAIPVFLYSLFFFYFRVAVVFTLRNKTPHMFLKIVGHERNE